MDAGYVIAGLGAATTFGGWIIKMYVTNAVETSVLPVREDIRVHKAEDLVLHASIKESLARIERKIDRIRD